MGGLLHPERESQSALDELKTSMGTMEFSAQYQQAPVPAGGNLIKWSWFKFYDQPPASLPSDKVIISWDTALSSSQLADYSACVVLLVRHPSIYVVDVIRARLEYPDLKRAVLTRLRHRLNFARSGIPDRAVSQIDLTGSYQLDLPGAYKTGIPEVDATYARYSLRSHHLVRLSFSGEDRRDRASPHHRDPVTHAKHFGQIARNQQHSQALLREGADEYLPAFSEAAGTLQQLDLLLRGQVSGQFLEGPLLHLVHLHHIEVVAHFPGVAVEHQPGKDDRGAPRGDPARQVL